MFVPDLMHEFELGVWKAVLMHLIRVLIAAGGDLVQRLDERYVGPYCFTSSADYVQVCRHANLWARHDSKAWGQRLGPEETRRPRL